MVPHQCLVVTLVVRRCKFHILLVCHLASAPHVHSWIEQSGANLKASLTLANFCASFLVNAPCCEYSLKNNSRNRFVFCWFSGQEFVGLISPFLVEPSLFASRGLCYPGSLTNTFFLHTVSQWRSSPTSVLRHHALPLSTHSGFHPSLHPQHKSLAWTLNFLSSVIYPIVCSPLT